MKATTTTAKRLFQLAAAVVLLGGAAAFAWFNYAWSDQANEIASFTQLPPRSGLPVEVAHAGEYTIWAGAACSGYCQVPPKEELLELMVLGFEGPEGMIRPEPFPGELKYRVSGTRFGQAAWTINFPEAGTYTLERRNLGVSATQLLLGEGHGLSSSITKGVWIIVGVTAAVSVSLAAAALAVRRKAMAQMIAQVVGR